jgi:hypothetical protein
VGFFLASHPVMTFQNCQGKIQGGIASKERTHGQKITDRGYQLSQGIKAKLIKAIGQDRL